mmetsp:Transcript_3404/g.2858  ORF Transcript_3404/g.2858 Transcript_3404/m.2858 type:complete len:88 (-) Transcript_3404:123-386(-)
MSTGLLSVNKSSKTVPSTVSSRMSVPILGAPTNLTLLGRQSGEEAAVTFKHACRSFTESPIDISWEGLNSLSSTENARNFQSEEASG